MKYHDACRGRNAADSSSVNDLHLSQEPSLAARLIARRFGMAPVTAALLASLCGLPATVEE